MKKYIFSLIALLGLAVAGVAFANSSYFAPRATSATATSSPTYLAVNTSLATTTLIYDSYGIDGTNQNAGQKSDATDSVALKMYFTASSTSSVLVTKIEYADGIAGVSCKTTPTACDWYENNVATYAVGAIAIVTPESYTWTYASTTVGGAAVLGSTNTGTKLIVLPVPTRYIRAVFSISGANGALYSEFVPKKQQ